MKYGAGFSILRDAADKGGVSLPISSQTLAVGDLIELTAAATTWAAVTSSSNFFTRKAICLAAATSSDTEVLAVILDGNEDVQVQSANASDAGHNGDRMAATDKNTVNNSGSDVTGQAVVFVQRGVLGATTDNQIWGHVLVGNGVDPDAAK